MNTLKFKTNINCNGCKLKVSPFLDKTEKITKWFVDLDSKDKTLTIESDSINSNEILQLLAPSGFKIEEIK